MRSGNLLTTSDSSWSNSYIDLAANVHSMSHLSLYSMTLFVLGLIILIVYGLYQGFQEINFAELNLIVAIGVITIILGLVILFVAIIKEQQEGKKKMKKDIKKEDLEP